MVADRCWISCRAHTWIASFWSSNYSIYRIKCYLEVLDTNKFHHQSERVLREVSVNVIDITYVLSFRHTIETSRNLVLL